MRTSHRTTTILKHNLWIAGIIFLLSSCLDTNMVYHVLNSLPDNTWEREDTISFSISSLEPGHTYKVFVEGRILQTYPYQQLHFQLLGDKTPTHLILDSLHNDEIVKSVFVKTVTSEPTHFTPDSSSVTFRLVPYMKREKLPGISDLGIRIER